MTKNLLHLSYHIIVLLLSAAIALSIPHVFSTLAKNLLSFWAYIENEKMFLVSLEICTAASLIFFFNYVRQGWEARTLSRLATSAGLVPVRPVAADLGVETDQQTEGGTEDRRGPDGHRLDRTPNLRGSGRGTPSWSQELPEGKDNAPQPAGRRGSRPRQKHP